MSDNPPKILVLDDEPLVLRALQLQLDRFGFEVDTADHPDSALIILQASEYDVLICDNNMPSMSGTEFLLEIQGLYPSMKRFMLTGSAPVDENGSEELESLSVVEVFRKPCHVAQMADSIMRSLGRVGPLQ